MQLKIFSKGGVGGENGYFRRNHLVPVPVARGLEELNEQTAAGEPGG